MSEQGKALILQARDLMCDAMRDAGVTRKELGRRLGITGPAVTMMLDERNMTLRTVADVFHALGLDVEITVRPRKRGAVESSSPQPAVSLPKATGVKVKSVGDIVSDFKRMLSCKHCGGTGYAMYFPGGMLPCNKCNAKGGEAGR